jgi:outer membrane lipoprotein-sorting protein
MNRLNSLFSVALTTTMLPIALAAPAAGDLQATIARLNASSAHFESAEAKVQRVAYTAVIRESDTQDGSQYVIRGKDGKMQFGVKTDGPNGRTVEYRNGTARVYNPSTNCYNTITKPGIDTYLSLGFGASGTELSKVWNIQDLGPETIDGVKTEKLDLVPKDASVKQNLTHVTAWIDLDRDVTLKLILFSPSGDTNTATYSDIRLNQRVNTKAYAINGKPC